MFMDPGRSQFDLNFRLLGIPVRVHPFFWLMALILGQGALRQGVEYLLLWVVCVFVSILIHEMGHVVMGRVFGNWGEIVLYGLGGLAVGASGLASRWKRIAVYFAGPLAQFVLLGLVVLAWLYLPLEYRNRPHLEALLNDLFWVNLAWPILNLLPIWPLDGGQISREVFDRIMPRRGVRVALTISLILSALLVINSLLAMTGRQVVPWLPTGSFLFIILFSSLAVGSFQALQAEQARRSWVDDHFTHWERDEDRDDSYRGRY
jgi:Zn-dependent protease